MGVLQAEHTLKGPVELLGPKKVTAVVLVLCSTDPTRLVNEYKTNSVDKFLGWYGLGHGCSQTSLITQQQTECFSGMADKPTYMNHLGYNLEAM